MKKLLILREESPERLPEGWVCRCFRAIETESVRPRPIAWDEVDGVIFPSPRGVSHFFEAFSGPNARPAFPWAGALGPGTRAALAIRGVEPQVVSDVHTAEGLVRAVCAARPPPARLLVVQGTLSKPRLVEELRRAGYSVQPEIFYETRERGVDAREELWALLMGTAPEAILVPSGSAARSFVAAAGHELSAIIAGARVISIGASTTADALAAGLRIDREARVSTIEGMLAELP